MAEFTVQIVPILLAITLHEIAHGWVARRLGDPTAASLGRLSLNPMRHVDPVGTLLFPLLQLLFPPHRVVFGWAKPVPVDPRYFRDPRRGMALVALGGPAINIAQAFVAAGLIYAMLWFYPSLPTVAQVGPKTILEQALVPLFLMAVYAVPINGALAAFNLIPIPPLDGSRVLLAILPRRLAQPYEQLERYGLILVLVAVMLAGPVLSTYVIRPALVVLTRVLGLDGLYGF